MRNLLADCTVCAAHFSPGVSADLSTIFDVGGIVGKKESCWMFCLKQTDNTCYSYYSTVNNKPTVILKF